MTTDSISELPCVDVVAGDNDRLKFSVDELEALARSIERNGLLQPITVRRIGDGVYRVVAGERRFRACRQHLGWETIPAIVRDLDDRAESDAMLVENTARVDLNPAEEAEAYRRRVDGGQSIEEVALVAGVTVSRVGWRLDLLRLRPDLLHLLRVGQLPVGAAWEISGLDSNRQGFALRAMAEHDFRPSELAALCRQLRAEQDAEPMFDPDSFFQIEEYVDEAKRRGLGKKGLLDLVGRLAAELEEGHPVRAEAEAVLASR